MPMQVNVPVDIADVIQQWLRTNGVSACAEPLPPYVSSNDPRNLPITLVQPIGGGRTVEVLDRHAVRLYTWAYTYADAIAACSRACAVLKAMEGQVVDGTQIYRVSVTALPYPAHDTRHPDVPRACTTADVYARATTINI